jgi:hypothetical protein
MKNNSGVSLVGVVLIVVVLALGGFGGWYVWQNNNTSQVSVNSFAECAAQEGAVIQESYPEVCVYKDQRFDNPNQKVETNLPVINEQQPAEDQNAQNSQTEEQEDKFYPVFTVSRAYYETNESKDYGFAPSNSSQFLIVEAKVTNPSDLTYTLNEESLKLALKSSTWAAVYKEDLQVFVNKIPSNNTEIKPGKSINIEILGLTAAEAGSIPQGANSGALVLPWDVQVEFNVE